MSNGANHLPCCLLANRQQHINATIRFEEIMATVKHSYCVCCLMVSLTESFRKKLPICDKCAKINDINHYVNKKELPIWFMQGDSPTPRFDVPMELYILTLAEKMLIQLVSPFVPLQHIKNGVMGLHGHVCAFEQSASGFLTELPRLKEDVSILRVMRDMKTELGKDAIVKKALHG